MIMKFLLAVVQVLYLKQLIMLCLEKKEGTKVAQKIFEKTTNRVHKHNMDMELGVSPHIIKYTTYLTIN